MAGVFCEAGAMRWRMSRGVPKVRESMSSVEMPYTWRREGGKGEGWVVVVSMAGGGRKG
jgi:hypothetical protein